MSRTHLIVISDLTTAALVDRSFVDRFAVGSTSTYSSDVDDDDDDDDRRT